MKWTEYDTLRRDYTADDKGNVVVKSSEYLDGLLKRNKEMRDNETAADRRSEFKHYASIPLVIVEELMKKGLNIFNQDDLPRIKKLIETDYPYLKTTNMNGW